LDVKFFKPNLPTREAQTEETAKEEEEEEERKLQRKRDFSLELNKKEVL